MCASRSEALAKSSGICPVTIRTVATSRPARQRTLGAYAHQDLPFEDLVEALAPERSLSTSPIFQVMFVLQTGADLALPGLQVESIDVHAGTSQFDLSLALVDMGDSLAGAIEYNVDLFDQATMARLAEHYGLLLEAMVATPDRRLSTLPIVAPAEPTSWSV